ncbi:MAG: carbohydrate binding family 9 domain-containing protein [Acidobacteria bacterium]|nr:carbohydrate binding family 9 domain-containing protein [Acidobacteriota bacterium]
MVQVPPPFGFVPILLASFIVNLFAAGSPDTVNSQPAMRAFPLTGEITLDGRLQEEFWQAAEPATGFTQNQPNEGEPATEKTEVRILFTKDKLYVGVICWDSQPDQIVVTQGRRDGDLNDTDSILILLDTYDDDQNAFLFGTNPLGLEYDGQITGEGRGGGGFISPSRQQTTSQRGTISGFNLNWDGAWTVRAALTSRGWEAEVEIPFKTLRYTTSKTQWGVNFMRNVRRKNEQSFWAPIPRSYNIYRVSLAGRLEGLVLSTPRNLKFTPYALGGFQTDYTASSSRTRAKRDVGLDIKYSLTPNLTLDGTINTDFAQVEVDEEQVNLTRFDLFFPEKRPFFLENAGLFQFGVGQTADIFFSRRIGIGPGGIGIPIEAGTRLTGKLGHTQVGFLDMQTEEVEDVAPANNFLVGRLKHEFGQRSNMGFIFVNRQATDREGDHNRVWGVDGRLEVRKDGMISAFLARSATPGRPDRDWAGNLFADYTGDRWIIKAGYTEVQENFNAEVGFVPRRGFRRPQVQVQFNAEPKNRWIRQFRPHTSWTTYYNLAGFKESQMQHYDFEVGLQDGGEIGLAHNRKFERLILPFQVFPGVTLPAGRYSWGEWTLNYISDPSARVFFAGTYSIQGFYDGKRRVVESDTGFRHGAKLKVTVRYDRNDVDLPHEDFVTNLVGINFNYSFSPRHFVQALLQYNDRFHLFTSNIRVGFIRTSGTGLFVVYNERYDTLEGVPGILNRALLVKYTRLFDF